MKTIKTSNPEERVETGLVQFDEDWPGVFIRGDNAMFISFHLKYLFDLLKSGTQEDLIAAKDYINHPIYGAIIDSSAELLASCNTSKK